VQPISTVKDAVASFRGDGRGKVLFAISFGWFLSISVRIVYPTLLPYLRDAYGLTLTTAGLLLTVLWVAYAAGQLPGGLLADWAGERLLLIASSLAAGLGIGLVVVATSAVVLFVATALFGGATALYGVSRFTILDEVFPDKLGSATGVTMAAGDVGNAIMPSVAGFMAVVGTWQYGFGFTVPLFVLAAVTLWSTLPARESERPGLRETFELDGILPVLSRPAVKRGTVLLVLLGVVMQAFIGFYPTYLITVKEVPTGEATLLFGLFFAIGALLKPLAGRIYDGIGVRKPLLAITFTGAIGFAGLPFSTDVWEFAALTVLISGFLGFETVVISDLTGKLPEDARGTNLGAVRTVYLLLGSTSPVLFGALAERGYFDEGFLVLSGLAGVGMLFVLLVVDY
jgi:MFS family permease